MPNPIFKLVSHAPRLILAVAALALVGLGALAALSIGELSPRSLSAPGSDSEQARSELASELGYDPVPAIRLVLTSPESFEEPASRLAVATLVDSAADLKGVAKVVEGPVSGDAKTASLRLHFAAGADPAQIERALETIEGSLDPGLLELQVAGEAPAAIALRNQLTDDAPKLAAIAVPFALLVLIGIVGLRFGLLAFGCGLLGAGLAVGGTLLAGAIADVSAAAVVAAAVCGLALGAETSLAFVLRYREEGAELGAGAEAVEYSLSVSGRGFLFGSLAAAGTGLTLLAVGVEPLASIGFGLIAAGCLAPSSALISSSAALLAGLGEPAGSAMPMVSESEANEGGSRGFRALVALAGSRIRALAVAAVALGGLAFAIAQLSDVEVIDSSTAELGPSEVRAADEDLTAAFGRGADAPIQVAVDGPPEAPTTTIYRDSLARLDGVDSVGEASAVGSGSTFEVVASARPFSLAAQRRLASVKDLDAPGDSTAFGRPAAFDDATGELAERLPLAALVAILLAGLVAVVLFRSLWAPLVVLAGALPAAAALGLLELTFGEGELSALLDYQPSGAPHLIAPVLVGATLLGVGLFRSASFAAAVGEERGLGAGARGALARAGGVTILPAVGVGLVAAAFAGAWLGSDLLVAKEAAFGLLVGLLIDSLVVRPLLAPALVRLTISR